MLHNGYSWLGKCFQHHLAADGQFLLCWKWHFNSWRTEPCVLPGCTIKATPSPLRQPGAKRPERGDKRHHKDAGLRSRWVRSPSGAKRVPELRAAKGTGCAELGKQLALEATISCNGTFKKVFS